MSAAQDLLRTIVNWTPLHAARQDLAQAFDDLKYAVDSRGLPVRIRPDSTSSADCRAKLEEHLRFFNGSRFSPGDAELSYARNIALLVNAWIASMKCEAELKKAEGKSP